MPHSETCLANQKYMEQQRAEYFSKWPSCCNKCEGWGGGHVSYDPSPSGVGLSGGSFIEFEPCQACYEQNKCPRCGGNCAFDDESTDKPVCLSCNWQYGEWGAPEFYDCGCEDEYGHESAYDPFATFDDL